MLVIVERNQIVGINILFDRFNGFRQKSLIFLQFKEGSWLRTQKLLNKFEDSINIVVLVGKYGKPFTFWHLSIYFSESFVIKCVKQGSSFFINHYTSQKGCFI